MTTLGENFIERVIWVVKIWIGWGRLFLETILVELVTNLGEKKKERAPKIHETRGAKRGVS